MERYHHLLAAADKMPSNLKVLEYSILQRLLLITMHEETFLTLHMSKTIQINQTFLAQGTNERTGKTRYCQRLPDGLCLHTALAGYWSPSTFSSDCPAPSLHVLTFRLPPLQLPPLLGILHSTAVIGKAAPSQAYATLNTPASTFLELTMLVSLCSFWQCPSPWAVPLFHFHIADSTHPSISG